MSGNIGTIENWRGILYPDLSILPYTNFLVIYKSVVRGKRGVVVVCRCRFWQVVANFMITSHCFQYIFININDNIYNWIIMSDNVLY